jgi:hypothetical protein
LFPVFPGLLFSAGFFLCISFELTPPPRSACGVHCDMAKSKVRASCPLVCCKRADSGQARAPPVNHTETGRSHSPKDVGGVVLPPRGERHKHGSLPAFRPSYSSVTQAARWRCKLLQPPRARPRARPPGPPPACVPPHPTLTTHPPTPHYHSPYFLSLGAACCRTTRERMNGKKGGC